MLKIVGVRHHSPACARLVEHTLTTLKPRYVLIEGPEDMTGRLDELLLPHTLPLAMYAYRSAEQRSRGTWLPLCEYSPEWVALKQGTALGAKVHFCDLPAWSNVFDGIENAYSDRRVTRARRLPELLAAHGFENFDTAWDALFEQPQASEALEARLDTYFTALRGDDEAEPSDVAREARMTEWVSWALGQCTPSEHVVVVCGGFHAPVLKKATAKKKKPAPLEAPAGERVGTYLVPFSFRRLDRFTGYQSGMPSPAFYQRAWENPATAGEAMLFKAIEHLRAKAQQVSVADAIAASVAAHALKSLRGNDVLSRVDVLDALATALVKDALDVPLPWSRRGVLLPRTDPMVVELVAALSGDAVGTLAAQTPRPPLVDDVMATLDALDLAAGKKVKALTVSLQTDAGKKRSQVLHRMRVLEVPGYTLERAASFRRGATRPDEAWRIESSLDALPALIEAALYGGTLETATAGKLEERSRNAKTLDASVQPLADAILAGLPEVSQRWLAQISVTASSEQSLEVLGEALRRLLGLGTEWGAQSAALGSLVSNVVARGVWLFEGLTGATAPPSMGRAVAVAAIAEALREGHTAHVSLEAACALGQRRSADLQAPVDARGAGLGLWWALSTERTDLQKDAAVAAIRRSGRPTELGDFLLGLFALAREEVQRDLALIACVDEAITAMSPTDFLVAIPALRQAFSFFPPREKQVLAKSVVKRHGSDDVGQVLSLPASAEDVMQGRALDLSVTEMMKRYGLQGGS